jgi:hypothetical protein
VVAGGRPTPAYLLCLKSGEGLSWSGEGGRRARGGAGGEEHLHDRFAHFGVYDLAPLELHRKLHLRGWGWARGDGETAEENEPAGGWGMV